MAPRNLLVIMMDELTREGLGCYGGLGLTPNIDKLAAQGTRFEQAYTPSPICVPARACFQSGRYVFQNRCWSNAQPYRGRPEGWAHRLKAEGHETVSIGKLHYGSSADDNGYAREVLPLHVTGGDGWVYGLLRRQDHTAFDCAGFAAAIGPGEDPYSDYDRRVRDAAVDWLETEGSRPRDKPWACFVSFVRPHYPLSCPPDFYALYDPERLPPRRFGGRRGEYRHPVVNALRQYFDYDDHFPDERARQVARASYFGLCSFVDSLVGDLLGALEASGRALDTAVVLTADHGEMNGHHGLWTKMVMYEEAVGIPLILAGAGAPRGVCQTQASLVDVHQTALEAAGLGLSTDDGALPGRSLYALAEGDDRDRVVLSEYHDGGSITGITMLREGRWKYIAYAGFAPQLFDLQADPDERNDLGLSGAHVEIRARLHARLCQEFGDPEAISARAFADQALRIEQLGGIDAIYARDNYDHTPLEAEADPQGQASMLARG